MSKISPMSLKFSLQTIDPSYIQLQLQRNEGNLNLEQDPKAFSRDSGYKSDWRRGLHYFFN